MALKSQLDLIRNRPRTLVGRATANRRLCALILSGHKPGGSPAVQRRFPPRGDVLSLFGQTDAGRRLQ